MALEPPDNAAGVNGMSGITGSGTAQQVPVWKTSTSLGDSGFADKLTTPGAATAELLDDAGLGNAGLAVHGDVVSDGQINISGGGKFALNGVALTAPDVGAIASNNAGFSIAAVVVNILVGNFTAAFGDITPLTGTAVTQTVTGLQTTDQVHIECVSAPPSGYLPPNARVSAADTLELYFNTAVAVGITLGSLDFRLTILRPAGA